MPALMVTAGKDKVLLPIFSTGMEKIVSLPSYFFFFKLLTFIHNTMNIIKHSALSLFRANSVFFCVEFEDSQFIEGSS